MTDIESRVRDCFRNVFPDVDPARLPEASLEVTPQWDSVAHVTLLAALAEEFGTEMDDDWFSSLTSYQDVLEFARAKAGQAG
jgi:acyl carrier protein